MKNIFRNKKLLGICLLAAIMISCKHADQPDYSDPKENKLTSLDKGVSVKTPDWTKNPKGRNDLPSVKEDGTASNVNAKIMAGIKELPAKDIEVKNVIFMFFENLTEDLIASVCLFLFLEMCPSVK